MRKIRWKWKPMLNFTILILLFIFAVFILLVVNEEIWTAQSQTDDPQFRSKWKEDITKEAQQEQPSQKTPPAGRGLWFDQQIGGNDTDSDIIPWRTKQNIEVVMIANFLPHLRRKQYRQLNTLNAKVLLNAPNLVRSPPELVLLIPSMQRKEQNYLLATLHNLIENIAEEEKHFIQIVVMFSENPWDCQAEEKLANSTKEIGRIFAREIGEGLLEVIAPPKEWFPPDLEHIPPTFGDPAERMRWRTKQSLDYAFAMLHVNLERPGARYYVQLEDDIITVPSFIGRAFHNNDNLSHMAYFILMLYNSLPVDWILNHVVNAKFCSWDENYKTCLKKRLENVHLFKRLPPLFQHVGKHSSLPGKMQNLTEKNFARNGKIELERSGNPSASSFRTSAAMPLAVEHQLKALYEQFTPFPVDLQGNVVNGTQFWFAIEYNQRPIGELRGLRIFFRALFDSALSALESSLPPSLLQVRIRHGQGNSTFPEDSTTQSRNFFLLTPVNPLKDVRSIQIGFTEGNWQPRVRNFTLAAIEVIGSSN